MNAIPPFDARAPVRKTRGNVNYSEQPSGTPLGKYNFMILENGLYQCMECGYQTKTKGNLSVHARKHSGVKPFKCTLCKYESTNHPNLVRHMKRHTGEKPYGCPYCDHKNIEKRSVVLHLKHNHPTENIDPSVVVKLII